jgi:hypothetical protein
MGLQKYRADKAGDITANGAQPFYANWMGGPTLALIRNCPIETKGVSIPPRTVYVRGEPDTAFSIPAACSYRGKIVKGFITCRDGEYLFVAYDGQF